MKIKFLSLSLSLIPVIAIAASSFKSLHVDDLERLMKSGNSKVAIYDVNVESTRTHAGIIPGAKLLSSSNQYDVTKELPADKATPLVFYCANTRCTASHTAAEKAIKAGYSDVSVMVDGIYGWKKAGKPIARLSMPPRAVTPKEALALLQKKDALIVDVREEEERHEIIDQAQWFPMSQAEKKEPWARFESALPRDKTVIFHCAVGYRAKKAAEKLSASGFKAAFFQGPDQWRSAGLPLKPGPAR